MIYCAVETEASKFALERNAIQARNIIEATVWFCVVVCVMKITSPVICPAATLDQRHYVQRAQCKYLAPFTKRVRSRALAIFARCFSGPLDR